MGPQASKHCQGRGRGGRGGGGKLWTNPIGDPLFTILCHLYSELLLKQRDNRPRKQKTFNPLHNPTDHTFSGGTDP